MYRRGGVVNQMLGDTHPEQTFTYCPDWPQFEWDNGDWVPELQVRYAAECLLTTRAKS
jgi:hypothetical protein